MTVEQLKAAVYDRIRTRELLAAEIAQLNQLISEKEAEPKDAAPEAPKQ